MSKRALLVLFQQRAEVRGKEEDGEWKDLPGCSRYSAVAGGVTSFTCDYRVVVSRKVGEVSVLWDDSFGGASRISVDWAEDAAHRVVFRLIRAFL